MGSLKTRDGIAAAVGFFCGWLLFSGALLLGSRVMKIGPGLANPLPYMAVAAAMALIGRLLRKWVG
jgi:hypothetical protein